MMIFVVGPHTRLCKVRVYEETLFRGCCLNKIIVHVSSKDHKIFSRRGSIEEVITSLVNTVGIGMIQQSDLSMIIGPIKVEMCYLASI